MCFVMNNSVIFLKQRYGFVSVIICILFSLGLGSLHAETCSQKVPNGICPAGKTCLLNGNKYGCYGHCEQSNFGRCLAGQQCLLNEGTYGCYDRCTKRSFGTCSDNHTCMISYVRITKNLKKVPVYGCFSCSNMNPFGTCPAGKSCFTCNGATSCVEVDFVCQSVPKMTKTSTKLSMPSEKAVLRSNLKGAAKPFVVSSTNVSSHAAITENVK